jgi:hypothetical protein
MTEQAPDAAGATSTAPRVVRRLVVLVVALAALFVVVLFFLLGRNLSCFGFDVCARPDRRIHPDALTQCQPHARARARARGCGTGGACSGRRSPVDRTCWRGVSRSLQLSLGRDVHCRRLRRAARGPADRAGEHQCRSGGRVSGRGRDHGAAQSRVHSPDRARSRRGERFHRDSVAGELPGHGRAMGGWAARLFLLHQPVERGAPYWFSGRRWLRRAEAFCKRCEQRENLLIVRDLQRRPEAAAQNGG